MLDSLPKKAEGQATTQTLLCYMRKMDEEITRLNELNHEQSNIILDLQTNSVKPTEDSK